LKSSQCHGCGKQRKTKGTTRRPEGIFFTNADPQYAGKLDDPQGGDTTMLMQQVREVMTVNQEMKNESIWIWVTSEQMGFPLRSELSMRIIVKPEVRNNATTSVLMAMSTVTCTCVSSKNCIQAHIHSANILPHIKVYFSERQSCATRRMSFLPSRRHRGPLHRTRWKACRHLQRAQTLTLD